MEFPQNDRKNVQNSEFKMGSFLFHEVKFELNWPHSARMLTGIGNEVQFEKKINTVKTREDLRFILIVLFSITKYPSHCF